MSEQPQNAPPKTLVLALVGLVLGAQSCLWRLCGGEDGRARADTLGVQASQLPPLAVGPCPLRRSAV